MIASSEKAFAPGARSAGFLRLSLRAGCVVLLAAGCRIFDPPTAGTPPPVLPESFQQSSGMTPSIERWWETFAIPELSRLVDAGLAGNPALDQSYARMLQAQALARKAGAGRLPTLDGEAGAGTARVRRDAGGGFDRSTSNDFSVGLVAAYEVDLWGRVRSGVQRTRLDAAAAELDLQAAAISLAGEIVIRWLQYAAATSEADILNQQLAINRQYLELLQLRQRKSLATALDVSQQRQIVAATETLIPPVLRAAETASQQINLLLGRPPGAKLELTGNGLPPLPPLPEAGLPAGLLESRPDLQAAWQRLRSAEWELSAARADRLPALRLTGAVAYEAGEIDDLFDGWSQNLLASLVAPLIDGGRRRAEVERVAAVLSERIARYREVVLLAVGEVEDALTRERHNQDRLDAMTIQLDHARNTLSEAENRYRKGLNDYLPVLAALESVQRLERSLVLARYDLLLNRVALCRALGGQWPKDVAWAERGNAAGQAAMPPGDESTELR